MFSKPLITIYKNLFKRYRGFLFKILLPWAFLLTIAVSIFNKSNELLTSSDVASVESNRVLNDEEINVTEVPQFTPSVSIQKSLDLQTEEWCETLTYKDLSQHESILSFENWFQKYEVFQCLNEKNCIHDPRIKWELLRRGEKMAQERAKIFKRIIRNDPKKALELAIKPNRLKIVPDSISTHLEEWVSVYTDIKAVHICKDPERPMGMIKRFATLPDGQVIETHMYGRRKYLKTTDGVSIWGVKMGDDAAISENAYQIEQPISNSQSEGIVVKFADMQLEIPSKKGLEIFQQRVLDAERRASITGRVRYPLIASSTGSLNLIDLRYTLVTNRLTWKQAQQVAFDKNATLVNINSGYENGIILKLLTDASVIGLFPASESNNSVQYSWIGASDSGDANGSFYSSDSNQTTFLPNINATEGDWKWQDGNDISASYVNWKLGTEPANSGQDYGALDFNDSNGSWVDLNESYRLPYVLEHPQQTNVTAPVKIIGRRKVLVIPSRFRDEGNDFLGSSSNPTDQFGNPLNPNYSNDTFEPFSRESLISAMERVKDFYLRNSDGDFTLDYVITPTVTLDIPKFKRVAGPGEPNIFDSTGQFYQQAEIEYTPDPELGYFGEAAKFHALELSPKFDYEGPAFEGLLVVSLNSNSSLLNFPKPPAVRFTGGNIISGVPDPDFEEAQGVALLDENGSLYGINITNSGAFYHSDPKILLDGVDYSNNFVITRGRTVVSWVSVTSYSFGAAGVGYVGAPGSHVKSASADVIVHELGHNFGLWHANRNEGEGIRPNSDEGTLIDYGNPYSVMGTGGAEGDFTISSKVYLKNVGSFGLKGGSQANKAVDVADLNNNTTIASSGLFEQGAINPNTFRIYRHDYGSAPYPLKVGEGIFFDLDIPSGSRSATLDFLLKTNDLNLSIGGPGEGAAGYLKKGGDLGYQLEIVNSGKGFSEEPSITVLDDQNQSLLSIDPSWIKIKAGSSAHYEIDTLRDFSSTVTRGLRGVEVPASQYSPKGLDALTPLSSYWVSYRRKASEYGLSFVNGTSRAQMVTSENTLLDMTPNTQGVVNSGSPAGVDFKDAFLLLGRSFSDYEADSHVTPIRKGGIAPMEYIEVVVNVGTVKSGEAKAPKFDFLVSNTNPAINEVVEFTVNPKEGNFTDYAYAWYVNEVGISEPAFLNNKSFSNQFTSTGHQVVKVVLSDFKGGISSRNITILVGNLKDSLKSVVKGQVKSPQGSIQGAKVVISKAKIIEHSVRVTGSLEESRINSTHGNNLKFVIDNEQDKQLIMNRGEVHRFIFEPSTNKYPLNFFQSVDHTPSKIKLNLLFSPSVEEPGGGYMKPPVIQLNETSRFNAIFDNNITTLDAFRQYQVNSVPYDSLGTLISKPSAKSLLFDTNVSRIIVRPIKVDLITGLPIHFGGRGMVPEHPPPVTVLRSSYWEDYNDTNATANAYVDGVGTIGLLPNPNSGGGTGYSTVPDIVVLGAGQDANYTASVRAKKNGDPSYKRNNILETPVTVDQGFGYDGNSTLAVALYPTEPFAYWSFNETESLYKDGPLKPTSGFNLPIEDGLIGYWKMDEDNSTTFPGSSFTIEDNSTSNNNFIFANGNPQLRSFLGTKNRSIKFGSTDAINGLTNILNTTAFTFSFWAQADSATHYAEFSLGDFNVSLNSNSISLKKASAFVATSTEVLLSKWTHITAKLSGGNLSLYVNGEQEANGSSTTSGTNLTIQTGFQNIFIDEMMVYNRALSDTEIGQLAGNIFLDLSGKKLNTNSFYLNEGSNEVSIDSSNLSSGVYKVVISNEETTVTRMFVKK